MNNEVAMRREIEWLERRLARVEGDGRERFARDAVAAPGVAVVARYWDLPSTPALGAMGYVTGIYDDDRGGWFDEPGTLPPQGVGRYQVEQVRYEWDYPNAAEANDTFVRKWMPIDRPLYAMVTSVERDDLLECVWVDPVTYQAIEPPTGDLFTVAKPYHLRRTWFDREDRVTEWGLTPDVVYLEGSQERSYEFDIGNRARGAWVYPSAGDAENQLLTPDYVKDEVITLTRSTVRIPTYWWPQGGASNLTFVEWEDMNTAGRCWARDPEV